MLAVVPFLRCWNYGIVDLDDYIYLMYHKEVTHWSGFESLKYFFISVEEGIWMPLTWLSYAFDYIIFGEWFGGFHLHSITVHAINTFLVWWLLIILFDDGNSKLRTIWICFIGAAIWSAHPLRCESVVFLASRKDVLSFFWELLALICWAKGSCRFTNGKSGGYKFTAAAMALYVIASMCKPSVMTFPVLCLLMDMFIYREIRILRYVPAIAYMLFLGAFAAWQQKAGGATFDPFNQPLWGRVLGACAAFGIYLRNFAWPQWLAPQCVKTWPAMPRFLIPGLVISAAWGWWLLNRAATYWNRKKEIVAIHKWYELPLRLTSSEPKDYFFVGMAWFAVAIAPMLGIASFGYHAFADRFTYIPSVGLSILIILALRWCCDKGYGRIASFAALIIGLAFAVATWRQTGYWKDDNTLFSHTLEVDGDHNGAAHGIIANWSFEFPHDLDRSVAEFEKAIGRNINYVMPCYNIYIIALAESGQSAKIAEAMKKYEIEVERQLGPDRARAVWNSDNGLSRDEQFYRSMYYCCKIIWLLNDPQSATTAGNLIAQLKGPALEKDPVWLYVMIKHATVNGDTEEAEQLTKVLLDPEDKVGYIRFRYAKNGLPLFGSQSAPTATLEP